MTITPATHAISINPATGEQLSVLPWAGVDDIENALQLAAAGFRDWRETNIDYRAEKLRDIGKALRARSEEMAQMITREMGKPINQARAEVAKSANLCDWYAEHGPAMLKAEPTLVENQQAVIEYRPLGTILAIMPWNFPLWQVMRGAVPIILAGNGYLLKHAPNVMGCAQLVAQVFKDAGIPQGVYGWLNADNDGVSQMIKDSRIAAVTVTGSVRAGAAIGAQAGAALKKCVLELGGSDPFIVLNDADLELAVKAAVAGRYQNTGQVCAAAKRFIIEEGIASALRKLWGQLMIASRSLLREVKTTLPDSASVREFARLQIVFAHCLRMTLRKQPQAEVLAHYLKTEDLQRVLASNSPANRILLIMGEWLAVQRRNGQLSDILFISFNDRLNDISAVLAGCERIAYTPIPFAYTLILHRTVYLFCIMLPFALVVDLHYMTPFISVLISYTFISLDCLAEELEDPFGTENNDLPLDAICNAIEIDLLQMNDEAEIPAKILPDRHYQLT